MLIQHLRNTHVYEYLIFSKLEIVYSQPFAAILSMKVVHFIYTIRKKSKRWNIVAILALK